MPLPFAEVEEVAEPGGDLGARRGKAEDEPEGPVLGLKA